MIFAILIVYTKFKFLMILTIQLPMRIKDYGESIIKMQYYIKMTIPSELLSHKSYDFSSIKKINKNVLKFIFSII